MEDNANILGSVKIYSRIHPFPDTFESKGFLGKTTWKRDLRDVRISFFLGNYFAALGDGEELDGGVLACGEEDFDGEQVGSILSDCDDYDRFYGYFPKTPETYEELPVMRLSDVHNGAAELWLADESGVMQRYPGSVQCDKTRRFIPDRELPSIEICGGIVVQDGAVAAVVKDASYITGFGLRDPRFIKKEYPCVSAERLLTELKLMVEETAAESALCQS